MGTVHQYMVIHALKPIKKIVGHGNTDSFPANTPAKRGNTNVNKKIVTIVASPPITAG